jgi:hypothetical protein
MRLYLFRQWYDFIRKIRPVSYGYSFENLLALLHDHAPAKVDANSGDWGIGGRAFTWRRRVGRDRVTAARGEVVRAAPGGVIGNGGVAGAAGGAMPAVPRPTLLGVLVPRYACGAQKGFGSHQGDYGSVFDATVVVSRTFLSRERSQIRFRTNIQLLGRVETTGEKYVVNELIELADISLQLQFAFGSRFNEFKTEPYAGKRGSQLMRRMGEQNFVSIDQAFDAGGSLIEVLGQAGNLVAALNLDACLQIARSKRFDAALYL